MKIANKTFYKRHSIELERFLVIESSLHIINENSKNKIVDDISHKVYFNPENLDYKQIEFSKKYDTIIFTDIIESGTDIYNLLQLAKENLSTSGKLIITSLNTKYIYLSNLLESLTWQVLLLNLFSFFSLFEKLKNSNLNKINNIKINNSINYSNYFLWIFLFV